MSDDYVPADHTALQVPFVESPFLEQLMHERGWSEEDKALVREVADKGYCVVDLGLDDFDEVAERINGDLAPRFEALGVTRIDEAWYDQEDVRALALNEKVCKLLKLLYQREPIPFQTLNFNKGTSQPAHSDTIHFHTMPGHYMAGAWIPLEDMDDQRGTLFVVPGSHRLPTYTMEDLGLPAKPESYGDYEDLLARILEMHGFQREPLYLKKGQAAVWVANLAHGGMPVLDPDSTRHSQANHYVFEDCVYYMPMSSDVFTRKLCLRENIDIRTGRFTAHHSQGAQLDPELFSFGWRYPRPLPDWVEPPEHEEHVSEWPADPQQRILALESAVEMLRSDQRNKQELIDKLSANLDRIWSSTPYKMGNAVRKAARRLRGS